jgi:uncharacterized RDD family membrane protein YckC
MENMDQILDAPQPESLNKPYAGFWIRVAAYLIDVVILWIALFIIALLASIDGNPDLGPLGQFINLIIAACYFGLMESSQYQATIGKMAVSIKVGDRNGNQISILNAFGRYFGKLLSALILLIGFLMVAWDEKNQGLHDKLADTYVFYTR